MASHARAALLPGLALVLACRGGLAAPEVPDLVPGKYVLSTVNGNPLPALYLYADDDNKLEFLAGSVTIVADRSFADSTLLRLTEAGAASEVGDGTLGTWVQNGNAISFSPATGGSYVMSWNGSNRLSQQIQGAVLVYLKP